MQEHCEMNFRKVGSLVSEWKVKSEKWKVKSEFK